jgi:hypothetical protein
MCRKGAREQGRTPSWTGRFCRGQRRRPHSIVFRGRSRTSLRHVPWRTGALSGFTVAAQWPLAVSLVDRLCHQVRLSRPCKVESTMTPTTTILPTLSVQRRESRHYWHWSISRPTMVPSSNLSETRHALPLVRCFFHHNHHHHFSRRETNRSLFASARPRDGPCVERGTPFCQRKSNSLGPTTP